MITITHQSVVVCFIHICLYLKCACAFVHFFRLVFPILFAYLPNRFNFVVHVALVYHHLVCGVQNILFFRVYLILPLWQSIHLFCSCVSSAVFFASVVVALHKNFHRQETTHISAFLMFLLLPLSFSATVFTTNYLSYCNLFAIFT